MDWPLLRDFLVGWMATNEQLAKSRACVAAESGLGLAVMNRRNLLLSLIWLPILGSCQPKADSKTSGSESAAPTKPVETASAPVSKPAASNKVRFKTSMGDIVVELNAEKAPVTVENFLGYVNRKHYDGTVFHRVIGSFMIQGGGFSQEGGRLVEKSTGNGITNESNNGLKNQRGTIAMARTNDPNSATAQFFINVVDNPMLNYPSNNGYAVFGKVVEGMEVVDKIKDVPTTRAILTMLDSGGQQVQAPATDVPVSPVVIQSVTAE